MFHPPLRVPKSRRNFLGLVAILVLGASLACSLYVTSPFASNATLSESPPATPTSAQTFAPGLASPGEGLTRLKSYRANLIVEFEGTRSGQPLQGRLESLTEVSREPAALHQYLKVDTTLTTTEIMTGVSEFYRLDDQVYIKKGEHGSWFTFTDGAVSPADLGFLDMDRLIILPAAVSQPPRSELLEGRQLQRYAFTEQELSDPNIVFEEAVGDMWLAEPGNHLAQYVISATLRLVIPDPKAHLFDQGRMTLRYTLTGVNTALTITPPAAAFARNQALNSLPRLSDAQIVSIFPTFIEYTSAITPIGAALFYRDELTTQGWTEEQAEIFNEKARLIYSKDKGTLTVLITPAEEQNRIRVLLDLN